MSDDNTDMSVKRKVIKVSESNIERVILVGNGRGGIKQKTVIHFSETQHIKKIKLNLTHVA